MLFGAVGEHGPDLVVAIDGALEDQVAAVGRPAGEIVAAGVVCELDPTLGGDVHDVDVLPAGSAGTVFAVPAEGEELAVGGPGRGDGVTAVGHALDVGAVDVHGVDLG